MRKFRWIIWLGVVVLSLALVGIGLAGNTPPGTNGSRSGTTDTTPPVVYVSPEDFSEGFVDVNNLPGWYMQNNSDPLGISNWFQGEDDAFAAQAGPTTSYIAANYNNTSGVGTISNWLLTPTQPLATGAVLKFWTRVPTDSYFPDRLEVRLSVNGSSTYVGTASGDIGDFTTLLLSINPDLQVGGYPDVWTPFTITLPSVPVGSTGRIAFRYFVTDGGNLGDNSAYIGIDTVEYTAVVVPEPDFSTSLKISPASSTQGEAISYSIHIINTGSLAGLDTSMVDPIPLGANYNNDVICSAGTCGFNAVTNTVFWHGSVDAQEDVEVQFSVNPNPGLCGVIVNQATITDPEAPAPVTVEATTEVVGPALNFQNFEATNGGYSSVSENTWSWGPPPAGLAPAHSGANVWATESPYVDFGDYLLVSGPINLAAADPNRLLMLQWWQKLDVEVNFDFAYVDISTNGGNTWTNLWEGDYHGSWEQISVDASSYKGQTVLLRFHLTTDDSVTYNGWAIDDVAFVSGCLPPVISIQPTSLTVTIAPDQQTTKQLNVCNHGEAPLTWTVNEVAPVLGMQSFNLPPFESVIIKGRDPLSAERAPRVYTKTTAPISEVFNNLMASQAYGIDVYNENLVTFNSDTPGTFTVIANLPGNAYFGGDFLNDDFSKLYVVDYSVNQLHTVNTTTGAVTVIGPAVPNPGQNWTGLTGAPDGTLYGSAADCATPSSLYTVNPNTGVVTLIGPVTNATCLIDIAVNAEGEMYGVDIAFDNLVHIDKATGAGTVVGSVGIDANYAQGLDFDDGTGTLYWAAYNNSTLQGELRVIDITTGNSSLIGAFSGGVEVDSLAFATSAYDAPWLSEAPILGDVLAGECSVVNVTFDSTGLSFGTYTSALNIKSNDQGMTVVNVPVTLYVNRNIYLPLVLKAP